MTAAAIESRSALGPARDPGAFGAFRAELMKLRSVPSVGIMLALAVAASAAISLFHAHGQALVGPVYAPAGPVAAVGDGNAKVFAVRIDPTGTILSGYVVGAALFAAFGAIAGALEYSSGMIRISLAVVPRRPRLFASKALAVAAVAFVAATTSTLALYFIGASFFHGPSRAATGLSAPGVTLHLVGAVVCLVGWAVIGFAAGMLLRSTALGVTVCLVLYIATPLLAETFDPSRANRETAVQTGQALWMYHSVLSPEMAPYGTALVVFLAYVAVFVGGALTRFAVADA